MAGRFTARRAAAPDLPVAVEDVPSTLEGVSWTVFPEPEPPKFKAPAESSNPLLSDKLLDAKVRLHRRLIEEINLSALEKLPEDEMRQHIQQLVTQYIVVERLALNTQELNEFVSEILDEMTGLGPLEPLLKDPSVSDILINGHESTYVERGGLLPRPEPGQPGLELGRRRGREAIADRRHVDAGIGVVRRVDDQERAVGDRLADAAKVGFGRRLAGDGT